MIVKYPTTGGLPKPVKPFGSINVLKDEKTNEITVVSQVLLDRLVDDKGQDIEGAEFGLALDGSASMTSLYGFSIGPFQSNTPNKVAQVTRPMLKFLAEYAGNGTVNLAFWAVGPGGIEIEDLGDIKISSIDSLSDDHIRPKKIMGKSTHLLPIMKHFAEVKFKNSKWSMAVIVTDGIIDDMDDVKKYTDQIAVEIDSNKRNPFKLVLIGLGEHVDAGQLEELDDFDASVDVDVWSAKLAAEMEEIHEIFDEVMSEELVVASSGQIIDNNGQVLKSYNDGVPAKMTFTLNKNSTGFKLIISGEKPIEQDLTEALNLLK